MRRLPLTVPSRPVAAVHLLVLSAFALAQPLFDLLGRNSAFFAARGSHRVDIIVFALGLALAPPAVLLALEELAGLVGGRARALLHLVFTASLTALIALQALRRDTGTSGWLLVAFAVALGAAGALAYGRLAPVRSLVTVLAPAPAIFLALFLFDSGATKLAFTGEAEAQIANVRAASPVVVVVFDEFPLASLLDGRGRIDAARYPHIAELARHATWFRQTTSVAEGTLHAVPAILDGRLPRSGEFPRYSDHPRNLFTLLGGNDELRVFEAETHLCPPKLCPASGDSFGARIGSLTADLSAVYLHALLPRDLARGIPSVSNGWQDFWGTTQGSDQVQRFRRFLAALTPSTRPTLYYGHVLLPHSPWQYLPSGRRYSLRAPPGWDASEVWTTNRAAVLQWWQRHMLQVAFADRLVGELLARLRATGLYERALLVVTADEGISFRPGRKRRPAAPANLQDIAYVPFFVKEPHQQRGRVVDAHVQTIDVLPTIAGALGVRIPWHVDGESALAANRRPESDAVIVKDSGKKRFVVPADVLARRFAAAVRRQNAIFGAGEPPARLYGMGPYRGLLGTSVGAQVRSGGGEVSLDPVRPSDLMQVSGSVPPTVSDVAVASGRRIVAVVPAAGGRFWALVPRSGYRASRALAVYAIDGPARAPRLTRLRAR